MIESQDKKLILLVDDDIDLLDSTETLLTNYGYNVITAENGKLGVEAFEKNNPDLTLMDVKMPEMDGYEAFFKIRERDSNARVIIMSGFGKDPRLAEAKSRCLIYLLEKPVEPIFLKGLISRHISKPSPC